MPEGLFFVSDRPGALGLVALGVQVVPSASLPVAASDAAIVFCDSVPLPPAESLGSLDGCTVVRLLEPLGEGRSVSDDLADLIRRAAGIEFRQ
ncbi:MAG: hypothetical protein ABIK43_06120 [candidate division WOR-3 bacterium]